MNARFDNDKAMAESSLIIAKERLQHDKSMAEAFLSIQFSTDGGKIKWRKYEEC